MNRARMSLFGLAALTALLSSRAVRATEAVSCEALVTQFDRAIASIAGIPRLRQARWLDDYKYAHEDPQRCTVDKLNEVQNRIEGPLILLHTGHVEVASDKIYRCAELREPGGLCVGAYADDTLSIEEEHILVASFASEKYCRLEARWPKAKLLDLYIISPTMPRRAVISRGTTFDRPPIGTSLVAVYRVGGHDKLRKLVWLIH